MEYRSDLKKHLKTAKIEKNNFSYELSYEKGENLKKLKTDEILKYVNDNYINDKDFKKENLINDLICFKTYKDDLEKDIRNQNIFSEFLSSVSTIAIGILTSEKTKSIEDIMLVLIVFVTYTSLRYTFLYIATGRKSASNKLVTVKNSIYILETLKDEMVAENKVFDTKNFNLEVIDADEVIEPNIYSVKVRESLEDKSN